MEMKACPLFRLLANNDAMPLYFIAVPAPSPIAEKICSWKTDLGERFGTKASLRSPAHITLVPPFYLKEEYLEMLTKKLSHFAGGRKTFQVKIDGFGHFGRKVIYAAVEKSEELESLRTDLCKAFNEPGLFQLVPDEGPFHPHITLAHRDLKSMDFDAAWEPFSKEKYRDHFIVKEISLFRNEKEGWNTIGRFPLLVAKC